MVFWSLFYFLIFFSKFSILFLLYFLHCKSGSWHGVLFRTLAFKGNGFYYIFSLKGWAQPFVSTCHFLCLHFLQSWFLLLTMAQKWAVLAVLLSLPISLGEGKWERSKTTCSTVWYFVFPGHWKFIVHQSKFCLLFCGNGKSNVTSAGKIIECLAEWHRIINLIGIQNRSCQDTPVQLGQWQESYDFWNEKDPHVSY